MQSQHLNCLPSNSNFTILTKPYEPITVISNPHKSTKTLTTQIDPILRSNVISNQVRTRILQDMKSEVAKIKDL